MLSKQMMMLNYKHLVNQSALSMPSQKLFPQRFASSVVQANAQFDIKNFQLPKQDQALIVERPWATKPFIINEQQPLNLPIFDLKSGTFTGNLCNLDPSIYNLPLRRDIVFRVNSYFDNLGKIKTHRTKTRGDVAGSGAKMRPQKKSGRARQGDKRAPHLWKGGKAHGPVPMDYTFQLNEKIRLLALKTILSAKLYEDRLILIDSEALEYGKTKYLNEIIAPYKRDKILFLHSFLPDTNFVQAASNIETLNLVNPQQFNLKPVLNHDWIFASVQGLKELEMIIESRDENLYRNRKVPRESLGFDAVLGPQIRLKERKRDRFEEDIIKSILEREDEELDSKPLEIVTESLRGYMQDLQQLQNTKLESHQQ